jgi:type I restriction enzyme S subunit
MNKRFGEIATFSRGLTFSKGDVAAESSKRVLRSNNIDLETHALVFDDVACLSESFVIPEDKMLHQNDIFICMSNGSTQHLGKVAFVSEEIGVAFGGFMGAIHPDETQVFPKYAFYACLSPEYRRFLASIFNGVNINNLKWSDLSDFRIPMPSLSEQERIVAELDLLQGIIDKQKAQLKELDALAQSIFYDMFGDPVENEKGWQIQTLNSVCDVRDGTHDSPSYHETGYPLITSKNVVDNGISFDNVNFISQEDFETISKRSYVDDGDILMPMIGTIGKPTIVKKEREFAIKNVALIKFLPNSVVLNVFIKAVMTSSAFDTYMRSNNKGGTQKFIALGDIRNLKIPVPPLTLQQSFATKIEAIESQKNLINQSITETQKLFDFAMDKYFG